MQENLLRNFKVITSKERLEPYGKDGADEVTVIARYLYNLELSKSFYTALQYLEISLRNFINVRLRTKYSDDWYHGKQFTLTDYQYDEAKKAFETINKLTKPEDDLKHGSVIAELTFGFWTAFFDNKHNNSGISPYLLKALKRVPPEKKNQKNIHHQLEKFRRLRNRVFHYERILHWKDLETQRQNILDFIDWINPTAKEVVEATCQFNQVFSKGIEPFKDLVNATWSPEEKE